MSPQFQLAPLSLIAGRNVTITDYGVIAGYSRIPDIMRTEVSSTSEVNQTIVDHGLATASGSFYTTLGITSNEDAASKLAKLTNANFETMELYAVAAATNRLRVNWSTLSALTNTIGSFDEWETCYREAAHKTAAAVKKPVGILYGDSQRLKNW